MAAAPSGVHCPARRRVESSANAPSRPLRTAFLALSLSAISAAVVGGAAHHHALFSRPGTVLRMGPLLRLRGAGNGDPTDLFQAARDGDGARVKELLARGADLTIKGVYGDTALRVAVRRGHGEVVKTLLDAGADASARHELLKQPLVVVAARGGYAGVVHALCFSGADPDVCNYRNESALHIAAERCDEPTARVLLEWGADPDARTWHGNTALQKGAERGGAAVVRTLLEFNASHTIIDRGWWREPLHYAKNAETVAALLAGGANHTALDKEGDTPLHLAALRGDAGAVAALLQGGAKSLNWRNPPGRTSPDYQRYGDSPLHIAVKNGRVAVAKTLIAAGANVDLKNEIGGTALFFAAKYNHQEIVHALLAASADMDEPDDLLCTPLKVAIEWKRDAIAQVLTAAGASAVGVKKPRAYHGPKVEVVWNPGYIPRMKLTPAPGEDEAEVQALFEQTSLQVPWGEELTGVWDANIDIDKADLHGWIGPTILRHPKRYDMATKHVSELSQSGRWLDHNHM